MGKRELICLLLFTCNYVVSVGKVSSSSECLGWATLFYCGTPSQVSYRFLALGCFPANLVSDVVCVLFVSMVGSLKG